MERTAAKAARGRAEKVAERGDVALTLRRQWDEVRSSLDSCHATARSTTHFSASFRKLHNRAII